MKLEDQVCSLELSKRLKELGVKQDSLWYWNAKEGYTPYISQRILDTWLDDKFAEKGLMGGG